MIKQKTQLYNWMRNQRKVNYDNTVSQMRERMRTNQYKDNIEDNEKH